MSITQAILNRNSQLDLLLCAVRLDFFDPGSCTDLGCISSSLLTIGHWPVTGSIKYWNVFRTSCGLKIHPIISNAKPSICTFYFILSRVPTRPGRYANSPQGVPTRPVRCGSFILQSWQNVKVQIVLQWYVARTGSLLSIICSIILRLKQYYEICS